MYLKKLEARCEFKKKKNRRCNDNSVLFHWSQQILIYHNMPKTKNKIGKDPKVSGLREVIFSFFFFRHLLFSYLVLHYKNLSFTFTGEKTKAQKEHSTTK